jgi:hypothetical protein
MDTSQVSIQLATDFQANILKSASRKYAYFPTNSVFPPNGLVADKSQCV